MGVYNRGLKGRRVWMSIAVFIVSSRRRENIVHPCVCIQGNESFNTETRPVVSEASFSRIAFPRLPLGHKLLLSFTPESFGIGNLRFWGV